MSDFKPIYMAKPGKRFAFDAEAANEEQNNEPREGPLEAKLITARELAELRGEKERLTIERRQLKNLLEQLRDEIEEQARFYPTLPHDVVYASQVIDRWKDRIDRRLETLEDSDA